MDVDGYVRADKVFEPAGVVEVQMADYDGFDVFDGVAGCCDSGRKFLFFTVSGPGKDIGEGEAPGLKMVIG